MKKEIKILMILIVMSSSFFAQNKFTIKGSIELDEGNLLLITERTTGVDTLAFTKINHRNFYIEGTTNEPIVALLKLEKYNGGFLMIVEPNHNYVAKLQKNGLGNITGGKLQEYFNLYRQKVIAGNNKVKKIRKEIMEANNNKHLRTVNKLNKKLQEVINDTQLKLDSILSDHKDSVLNAFIKTSSLTQNSNLIDLKKVYQNLSDMAKNTEPGKILLEKIKRIENTNLYKIAPNFTLTTSEGNKFSLYDLAGKIKIIDFWASWCGPCRIENPNMVSLYKDYKNKGLSIVSVSLDQKKSAWISAIKKDNLAWTQVSSLDGWKSEVVKLYNIDAVPTILILDESNRIIGKNLRGETLRNFISKRLDK